TTFTPAAMLSGGLGYSRTMAAEGDAWPQDDLTARATLLAWLEGELALDEAASRYAACFPPVARMDAARVQRPSAGSTPTRRGQLAAQIWRSMTESEDGD